MHLTLLKNLSFRTSLYLMGEVVKITDKSKDRSRDKPDADQGNYQWFVDITLAIPSDKAPVSRKRVRFPGPEAAQEALQQLVQEINDLREDEEEDLEEAEEDDEELDDISEVED